MRWRFLLLLVALISIGCANKAGVFVLHREADPRLESFAILPLLCAPELMKQNEYATGEKPQLRIAVILHDGLQASGKQVFLISSKRAERFGEMAFADTTNLSLFARELGEDLGANALVVGYLRRWQDLRGTWYAAKESAALTLELKVYRTADGALIWHGIFDKEQGSLSADILNIQDFIKRKGRWIGVEELAKDGIAKMVDDMPGLKR
ncbi:MAG: hypothetical protein K9K75_03670 [Deltaproteobacteria bacterium]|nr:hypothetical protein [Deltaproteobacteria bacterium]